MDSGMKHPIIVNPGYYFGFSRATFGKVDAWMHRCALVQEIERHHGSLSIIDQHLSDEIDGQAIEAIQAALGRSRDLHQG